MASSDAGPHGSDTDVFGNLPRSRAQRRSAKRDRPERADATAGARAASPSAERARAAATAKAGGSAAPSEAERAPESAIPPAGYATPRDPGDPALHGLALLATAVEAIGELVVIGLTAASQAMRAALNRLPRP